MNLRQAAQQALEAWFRPHGINYVDFKPYMEALRAALAEPDSDYERGFVDGMSEQAKRSVDKAVNRMAQTTHWEGCEAVHPECRKQEPVVQLEFAGTLPISRGGYAPTPRKPLTDEQMRECAQAMNAEPLAEGWPELIKFARAIERAHGIGDSNAT